MIIDHQPLSWYVNKLTLGTPFSLTKHSDASLYCMQGRKGGDCNGCTYTPALKAGLLASLHYKAPGYYHGIQRLTDRDNEAFDYLLTSEGISPSDHVWIDTGIIPSQFIDGGLYPLVEALRNLKMLVVVTNPAGAERARRVVPGVLAVLTPVSNTMDRVSGVLSQVEALYRSIKEGGLSPVFLLSCGMAACALVPMLHSRYPTSSFIDVGHLWDALSDNKIRHYQHSVTSAHVQANLNPRR